MIELSWQLIFIIFTSGIWIGSGIASGTMIYTKFKKESSYDRTMMALIAFPMGPMLYLYFLNKE